MQKPSSSPEVIATADELRAQVAAARRAGKTIGLVPTMGALHAGHASLVDAARRECSLVVVSIFVNPTQFAPGEDFDRYPRTMTADLDLLARHGADLVFAPSTDDMFPSEHSTFVEVGGVTRRWEGEFRPGHFRGVATVVLKLFNLVQPDRAYFGRKDYQQSLVVRHMVEQFALPIHVEVCPTVREPDGLAMSSRNRYLSPDERRRALAISRSLEHAKQLVAEKTHDPETVLKAMRESLLAADLAIDYIALVHPDTLEPVASLAGPTMASIAACVGATRLIDNELVSPIPSGP